MMNQNLWHKLLPYTGKATMLALQCVSTFLLAILLVGCSPVAMKGITVQLSPAAGTPGNGALTALQREEMDKIVQITGALFWENGVPNICSKPGVVNPKSPRIIWYGNYYEDHKNLGGGVYVDCRKEQARIGLDERGGWIIGSSSFRSFYATLSAKLVDTFGAERVK